MEYKIKIRTENQINNINVTFKPWDYDAVGYAENFIKNHFEEEFHHLLRQLDGDYDEYSDEELQVLDEAAMEKYGYVINEKNKTIIIFDK
jgi:hypothetical protein